MSGKNYLLVFLVFVSGRLYLCVLITLKQWPGCEGHHPLKKGYTCFFKKRTVSRVYFSYKIHVGYILVLIKVILFFYLDFPKKGAHMLSLSALAGNVARLSGNSNARATGEQWPRSRFVLIFFYYISLCFFAKPCHVPSEHLEYSPWVAWDYFVILLNLFKLGGGRHSLPNKREHNGE